MFTRARTARATRSTALLLSACTLTAAVMPVVLSAVPAVASGGGDDVRRSGSCSGATDWKIKAKADDGRIEVEAEIDSDHVGQSWGWRLKHDGAVSAKGTSVTRAPSGSFSVERKPVDLAGTDRFVFRAVNPGSGEVCRATIEW